MTSIVAFFNNKGGVGKTTLIYHLAWMYAEIGVKVVVADLDPQANLSAMFLDESQLERFWTDSKYHDQTIMGSINPIIEGTGDVSSPYLEEINNDIGLIVGDLGLSRFEDKLSDAWPRCMDDDPAAFRIISSFYRVLIDAASKSNADLVLMDVGPNLGAINRAALVAADAIVVPLAPDLFSLQGLRNLGPTVTIWRKQWQARLQQNSHNELILPQGRMQPIGYIVQQYAIRRDRPTMAYEKWIKKIPTTYQQEVLRHSTQTKNTDNELATLKHYRSLMPMAMEAHKPIFSLKPADGAIGAHVKAVQGAYEDFKQLALKILHNPLLMPSFNNLESENN